MRGPSRDRAHRSEQALEDTGHAGRFPRYGKRTRDSEVVASIAGGDPAGLAQAHDKYADPLSKYCFSLLAETSRRSLLADPADAADAVRDTFVIAVSRLDGLPDPEPLRAALARRTTAPPDEATDVTAGREHDSHQAERAGLHTLIEDATEGLDPADREAVELELRQGLEPAEVAAVLGVSRNRAHALLARARDQLQACLGVLLVGRAGRGECRELAGLLAGWDGRLTPPLRRRVHRHIERCPACAARRAFELRPAMLLGLSPAAAILAAAAESLRRAPGPPAALRAHTLALANGSGPSAIAHRSAVLDRAGPFGRLGFPTPMRTPRAGADPTRTAARRRAALVVCALLMVAIAAAGFELARHYGQGKLTSGKPPRPASAAVASAPGRGGPQGSRAPAKGPPPHATPVATRTRAATTAPATTPATTSPPPTPSTSPSPTPAKTSPTPARSPSPSPGTLQVSPPGGQLTVTSGNGATITLTARGGSVAWSIGVSVGKGSVSVAPSGGTLRAGARITVTIQASRSTAGRELIVKPGGLVFTLVTGNGNNQLAASQGPPRPPGTWAAPHAPIIGNRRSPAHP